MAMTSGCSITTRYGALLHHFVGVANNANKYSISLSSEKDFFFPLPIAVCLRY
jgi:hypothetical protein